MASAPMCPYTGVADEPAGVFRAAHIDVDIDANARENMESLRCAAC